VSDHSQMRAGYLYGLIAYVTWGIIPLYFNQISHLWPLEILSHRIVWSLLLLTAICLYMGQFGKVYAVLKNKKLVSVLVLSSILLAINWLLYIYATTTKRVSEASLGYYIMPLVNAFLGAVFLGEKLRFLHYPALIIVAIGISIPSIKEGTLTWLAIVLPISFGLYGFVRKKAPIDSLTGLLIETVILFVPSLVFLIWQRYQYSGTSYFLNNSHDTIWLMLGGIATVVPLISFALSIKRLPLLAICFIQFLSPTIQLIISKYVLHEHISEPRWAALICILFATILFLIDAILQAKKSRERSKDALEDHLEQQPTSVK
jgi:chloramphenicol-sensitive protein RarD